MSHAPIPFGRPTRAVAADLRAALDAVDARYRRALDRIPADARDRPRADGGWSPHQVLEHMTRANEEYLAPMRALAAALRAAPASDRPWRPTLMGGLFAKSLTMRIPLPAPRTIRPAAAPRPAVLEAMLATHAEVRALLDAVAGRDWRGARMRSPFAAVLRLDFGDAVLVVLRHAERHAGQLEGLAPR